MSFACCIDDTYSMKMDANMIGAHGDVPYKTRRKRAVIVFARSFVFVYLLRT